MKINELSAEGLKRSYQVVIPASDFDTRVKTELEGLKSTVNLKGFRPGKAPISLLEKQYGDKVRGQVLQKMVNEGADKVIKDNNLQPATQPMVDIIKFETGKDVEVKVEMEILPAITVPDLSKIKLEKLEAPVDDAAVKKIIDGLLSQQKLFEDAAKTAKAKNGDAVLIDFLGKIDGTPFEGAEAEDFQLELGSGSFIDTFEDQLIGTKAGDKKVVKVKFPKDYNMDGVAGKAAEFEVTVKGVKTPVTAKANDEFAKTLGFDDLKALTANITEQIEKDNTQLARAIVKRKLLDALSEASSFTVPVGMVDKEYAQIWEQIKMDLVQNGELTVAEAKTLTEPKDKADRDDFKNIAERRVRLGLLLAEVGRANSVQVSQEEINQQIMFEAQRFPGKEKEVFDYYRKNQQAVADVRAPVYEDKVVDLILETANVTTRKLSTEELKAAFEALENEDQQQEQKPAKKKVTAKKAPAKKAAPKKTAAQKPAKKAAPKKATAKKK